MLVDSGAVIKEVVVNRECDVQRAVVVKGFLKLADRRA
jgi:hypothetical protein